MTFRQKLSRTLLIASVASTPALAQRASAGTSRWYGAEPHVPMALVTSAADGSRIIEPIATVGSISSRTAAVAAGGRSAACANWSRVGAAWNAVDRWGQVV